MDPVSAWTDLSMPQDNSDHSIAEQLLVEARWTNVHFVFLYFFVLDTL